MRNSISTLAGGAPAYFVMSSAVNTAFIVGDLGKLLKEQASTIGINKADLKRETKCVPWDEKGGDKDQSAFDESGHAVNCYPPHGTTTDTESLCHARDHRCKFNKGTGQCVRHTCNVKMFIEKTFSMQGGLDVGGPPCKEVEDGVINNFQCHVLNSGTCPTAPGKKSEDICLAATQANPFWRKSGHAFCGEKSRCEHPYLDATFGFSKEFREAECSRGGTACFKSKPAYGSLEILVDHQEPYQMAYMGPYQLHAGYYAKREHPTRRMFMRFNVNGGEGVHHMD